MLDANINVHNYCNNNIFFIKKTLNSLKLVKFKINWLKYSIFLLYKHRCNHASAAGKTCIYFYPWTYIVQIQRVYLSQPTRKLAVNLLFSQSKKKKKKGKRKKEKKRGN